MDPFTIASIASAGLQGVLGLGQMVEGMSMRPKRPTYEIPDEIKNMLALRQMNLQGRMAGASQAQQNIMQGQGQTIGAYQGAMRNPNAILAGVSASQGQANRGFSNLASMEAQDYQRRLAGLEGAQRTMGQYRDKEFDINEMQPFQDEARTKAALIGSGLRNVAGAGQGVAGAFGEARYMDMLQSMYGQQGAVQQPATQQSLGRGVAPMDALQGQGLSPIPGGAPSLPNVNFFGPQQGQGDMGGAQQMSSGAEALMSNVAFNNWVFQRTGKNSTEFTPMQLSFFRSQYRG
jgi:hypothetical protein